jgi:hypothetical protein
MSMSIRNAVARLLEVDTATAKGIIEKGNITIDGYVEEDSTVVLPEGAVVEYVYSYKKFIVPPKRGIRVIGNRD